MLALFASGAVIGALAGGSGSKGERTTGSDDPERTATGEGGSAWPAEGGGVTSSAGGYALRIGTSRLTSGVTRPFRFAIVADDGAAGRRLAPAAKADMALVVVPHDLRTIQRLVAHPAGSRWTASSKVPHPGAYRVIADFVDGGRRRALGIELTAPGPVLAAADPKPSTKAHTGSGEVELAPATLAADEPVELAFRVTPVAGTANARPTDPELIAIRYGDFALVRGEQGVVSPGGRELRFPMRFPEHGRYRLFVRFRVREAQQTAAMTVDVAR